jgi:hypothetical protein
MMVVLSAAAVRAAQVRYDDVIYLADLNQPPLHLKALRRAPITYSRDPQSVIAYLAPGQSIEVLGLGETEHAVSAPMPMGDVQGWVNVNALEAPPAGLQAKLRQRRDRAAEHRDLIERHEVVVGMNRTEVRASLGKPDRTARSRTRFGDDEQWFYVTYKYTPHFVQQQNETVRFSQTLSYGRVPTGHRIITFRQDEVVEIGDDQTAESRVSGTAAAAQAGH